MDNRDCNMVELFGYYEKTSAFETKYGRYWNGIICTKRETGGIDKIPVVTSSDLDADIREHSDFDGKIRVIGSVRTYSREINNNKLVVYVNRVTPVKNFCCENNFVRATGVVRKVFRRGLRKEFVLLVQRGYGQKAYIPCFCVGSVCEDGAEIKVGKHVEITGTLQALEPERMGEGHCAVAVNSVFDPRDNALC